VTPCRPVSEIRVALKTHQKRLQLGDDLTSITSLAERSGLHRDTIYSLLSGNRISEFSQIRLSRLIDQLEKEPSPPSRIMHVSLSNNGLKLGFGMSKQNIF